MIKIVKTQPDIYFSTVWRGNPPKGCKTVYRAASVYYNSHERKRKGMNKKIALAIRTSDHVIYQTHFARKLCEKVLGKYYNYKVSARRKTIIVNGFDKSDYKSVEPAKQKKTHRFVACADWTSDVKRGSEIFNTFRKARIDDSELIMIGKFTSKSLSIKSKYIKDKRVRLLGSKKSDDIMSILKSRPIFVHISYAESCPNAAIEALSFGCPVICNNIGGTPEVVKDSGIIADCDNPFVFRRRPVDYKMKSLGAVVDAMRVAIEKTWDIDREDLSMQRCAEQYKKVFEDVLEV